MTAIFRLARSFSSLMPVTVPSELWWSQPPFGLNAKVSMPILSFLTGEPTGKSIELDSDVFNQPLRRDLVHNVFIYYQKLNWIQTHKTKRYAEISGSGKKMRPQKGSGQARAGFKRVAHWPKGAKVHGPVPRDRSIGMNKKQVLLALKVALTARLAEGKLKIVDMPLSGELSIKDFARAVDKFDQTVALLHGPEYTEEFLRATRNIEKLTHYTPEDFTIKNILQHRNLVITHQGIQQLQENIKRSEALLFRNKKFNRKLSEEAKEPEKIEPVVVKSRPLKELIEKYSLDIKTE